MSALEKLSPSERQALMEEARKELKELEEREKAERRTYKEIASNEVYNHVKRLKETVEAMKSVKVEIYNSLRTLVESKKEVFDTQESQKSHTFTTTDGRFRIIMGVRDISQWDGTETAGINKIQDYLKSLAKDTRSAELVNMVQGMLKPDKKGMLDPRRIVELSKIAEEGGNELFMDGINIIIAAYKVVGSKMFLEAYEKSKDNSWQNINLNFSEIRIE
ncbi:MAG: DUF3164 family protein [Bacteroidetes bacterium]|nr:DUF3164 family protein [Bacteroidota bacterium]